MKKEIEIFIIENQDNLYKLAFSYMKNREDALDVVQDSVFKALKNHRKFKGDSSVKTWFYRILINTAIDSIRKQNIYHSFDDDLLNYSYGCDDSYQDFDLKMAIDELPLKYKSVIILRYFDDLELKEIAMILDEPLSTIKTRLYQAQKKLKITLDVE